LIPALVPWCTLTNIYRFQPDFPMNIFMELESIFIRDSVMIYIGKDGQYLLGINFRV
ncbi:Hypothetical predicted protein, partial [Marmota monax]